MKEVKIKISSVTGSIAVLLVSLIISGSAVYIGMQYNQSQKEIAEIQAAAEKESASKMKEGLDNIGRGTCQTSTRQFAICSGY